MRRNPVHVAERARATRLGMLLKPAFVEQRPNQPLLYGDFDRVPVVATTERAASGGFGRNRENRKCLISRFLGQYSILLFRLQNRCSAN